MRELGMSVLNISGQAAIIFVVLLAVRGIFAAARVPKKYAYGLWAILFIRLLLPVQLEARWGLMPQESGLARAVENMVDANGRSGQGVLENMTGAAQYVKGQDISADWQSMFKEGQDAQPAQPISGARQAQASPSGSEGDTMSASHGEKNIENSGRTASDRIGTEGRGEPRSFFFRQFSVWTAIVGIWITGSVLFVGYGLFSYFSLKRKLCCSLRLEGWGDGIYLADGIETPFVLGIMTPRIYLPSNMTDKNYPYVLTHEWVHIRRRDYLFKLGAYLLTCLYWFHPLVWAGFILMGRDMEMSCDEAVLGRMGGDCRGEYADSLLRLTCGRHYPAAVPLAFGEGDTRGRIKHIMGYRKAAAAVAIAAVTLTGVLAAVLLASPREAAAEEGHLPQDSTPLELMEGDPYGESLEQTEDNPKFTFQVAYRDVISCPKPVMTGNTFLGADGAILDYADEDKVIFHGCFGLYVYSASEGKTIGAVDLQALGCGYTQGDNACQVLVNRDGTQVYFYPLGGIEEVESREQGHVISSYVYDVRNDRLRIVSWNLGQSGDSHAENEFSQLIGEELSECRAIPVEDSGLVSWEQGFCFGYGMVFERDGEQVCGYLKGTGETLEDLMYVQRPVYEENLAVAREGDTVRGGGNWREVVRLFGANGQGVSTVFYDGRESTQIIMDGVAYDLCQVMTECRVGDEIIELPQGNDSVNAITGLQCMDGLWIVEGHINPSRSTYSFYDPAAGEWICHIVGSCLTWSRSGWDEKLPMWEGSRESLLSTVIYALDNTIYSLQDGKLAFLSLEQLEYPLQEENYGLHRDRDGASVEIRAYQAEEICGLYRDGDEITVEIRSTQTEERRTVQFPCMRVNSGKGAIKLE